MKEFQSHIGAIRIKQSSRNCGVSRTFQSHIGAIRIYEPAIYLDVFEEFQSHIGAIRICLQNIRRGKIFNFNPTLVQLELRMRRK